MRVCFCVAARWQRQLPASRLHELWQISTLTIFFRFLVSAVCWPKQKQKSNLCTHLFARPMQSISGFLVADPAYLLLSNDLTRPIIHRTIFYNMPIKLLCLARQRRRLDRTNDPHPTQTHTGPSDDVFHTHVYPIVRMPNMRSSDNERTECRRRIYNGIYHAKN